MKSQYNKIVSLICGDNWETSEVSPDERDGGYGVAICLACLQGYSTRLIDLANAMESHPSDIEVAYKRLQINGVLSYHSPILNDRELKMSRAETESEMDACLRAWSHIAGLASGFIGKGSPRSEMVSLRK